MSIAYYFVPDSIGCHFAVLNIFRECLGTALDISETIFHVMICNRKRIIVSLITLFEFDATRIIV